MNSKDKYRAAYDRAWRAAQMSRRLEGHTDGRGDWKVWLATYDAEVKAEKKAEKEHVEAQSRATFEGEGLERERAVDEPPNTKEFTSERKGTCAGCGTDGTDAGGGTGA